MILYAETSEGAIECILSVEETDTIAQSARRYTTDYYKLLFKAFSKVLARNNPESTITTTLSKEFLQATGAELHECSLEQEQYNAMNRSREMTNSDNVLTEARRKKQLSNQILSFLFQQVHEDSPQTDE